MDNKELTEVEVKVLLDAAEEDRTILARNFKVAMNELEKLKKENITLKKEIDEYESVEQSLMKCVREGGGYDEMLPIHYRQESESDDE